MNSNSRNHLIASIHNNILLEESSMSTSLEMNDFGRSTNVDKYIDGEKKNVI